MLTTSPKVMVTTLDITGGKPIATNSVVAMGGSLFIIR
jgi:hypothetical protein